MNARITSISTLVVVLLSGLWVVFAAGQSTTPPPPPPKKPKHRRVDELSTGGARGLEGRIGTVLGKHGEPLAQAEVRFVSTAADAHEWALATKQDGVVAPTFVIPQGVYDISINRDGYRGLVVHGWQSSAMNSPELPFQLATGSGAPVQQQLRSVRGKVTDEAGKPLADCEVSLFLTSKGVPVGTTTSDEGGFQFNNVPPGAARIRAHLKGYKPAQVRVTDGTVSPATIQLVPIAKGTS